MTSTVVARISHALMEPAVVKTAFVASVKHTVVLVASLLTMPVGVTVMHMQSAAKTQRSLAKGVL
jgi:hypothetical protein